MTLWNCSCRPILLSPITDLLCFLSPLIPNVRFRHVLLFSRNNPIDELEDCTVPVRHFSIHEILANVQRVIQAFKVVKFDLGEAGFLRLCLQFFDSRHGSHAVCITMEASDRNVQLRKEVPDVLMGKMIFKPVFGDGQAP